ncbi:hypothetical protein M378DRAFT_211563 [Amanita muscaria Koide BX008]|uniref:DNA2/NAM7 helicase helicase domain-containing protein n=1 Tax=Amanita muscaria (strain Koide BX008) TaxID=946122 RepID=A0A0C2XQ44_AMAMK|nr:hypothetical protein M378DRAFT_211563 [Amanita muscaria Koide BX008]
MDALRLDIKKPTQVTHPANVRTDSSTHLPQLESIAYGVRVRSDKAVVVAASGSFGTFNIHGTVGWAEGRINSISTTRMLEDATDITVTTLGREDATSAEAHRASTLRRILQGAHDLLNNPWVRNIWFPHSDGLMSWPDHWTTSSSIPKFTSNPPHMLLSLNKSQQIAVNTMLSDSSDHHLTLVQGPPGTGKTSVIATVVQLSIASGRTGIWIVAQSNVAVKNVAEKLIKVQFTNWRLLVSKDFHFDWHEHLYSKLKENVIRSDDFLYAASRFDGNPVILCTLSMLSNKHVMKTFMGIVPVNYLVVDEASQIEIGNFMPTFIHCHSTLRKVSFIGDSKQCMSIYGVKLRY